MVGKWHLCPTVEMNLASTRRNNRRVVVSNAGTGSSARVQASGIQNSRTTTIRWTSRRTPEEGYHCGEDITDKAIEFIIDAKAVAPEKPFFLYYAPGACHAPHHAPDGLDRPVPRASSTWAMRRCARRRWSRQKEMGIVPAEHRASADQPDWGV